MGHCSAGGPLAGMPCLSSDDCPGGVNIKCRLYNALFGDLEEIPADNVEGPAGDYTTYGYIFNPHHDDFEDWNEIEVYYDTSDQNTPSAKIWTGTENSSGGHPIQTQQDLVAETFLQAGLGEYFDLGGTE